MDVALLHDVLHHVDNPAAYKDLAKYLKPTACIVIVDYLAKQRPHRDDPSLRVGKEEAAKLLLFLRDTSAPSRRGACQRWRG